MPPSWHTMAPEGVIRELKTDLRKGLTRSEAEQRRHRAIDQVQSTPLRTAAASTLWQLGNPVSWFWIVTTTVLLLWGRILESAAAAGLAVIRFCFVFVQEYKASRAFEDLGKMTEPVVHVLRDELTVKLRSDELVPGDIMLLAAEDVVPADARLLECGHLEVKESILTGDPLPVQKKADVLEDSETPVSRRSNMVYAGSVVVKGTGAACVVAVGKAVESGRYLRLSETADIRDMKLYRRFRGRGWWYYVLMLPLCCLMIGARFLWFSGAGSWREALPELIQDCALLVTAALPWGVLSLLTIITALGVKRMAARRAVVKSPVSVEKLSSVSAICSAKLGVLTSGMMRVVNLMAGGEVFRLEEDFGRPAVVPERTGETSSQPVKLGENQSLLNLMKAAILCTSAELEETAGADDGLDRWSVLGDSTEGALLALGATLGFSKKDLLRGFSKIDELPFDPVRKRMTVFYKNPSGKLIAFSKGAPETILGACQKRLKATAVQPFGLKDRERALEWASNAGGAALRILAFAYRELDGVSEEFNCDEVERDLVFLGMISLDDPPRENVEAAVRACRTAGVDVIMVSGDQKTAAARVGRDLGILGEGQLVLAGEDVDRLSEDELSGKIAHTRVFARVTPAHKLRIIRALQADGRRVAVIGESLTDIPSFAESDASVAMGLRGSHVVRKASDVTLTDDSFATLAAALEESRIILANIISAIRFMLVTHVGELLAILLVGALGLRYHGIPLPLTFPQLMLVNVLVLSFPAMVLGLDPVSHRRGRIDSPFVFVSRGFILAVVTAAAFGIGYAWSTPLGCGENLRLARTMSVATLVICQLTYALRGGRFSTGSALSHLLRNRFLLPVVVFSLLALILVLYVPGVSRIFQTIPLGWKPAQVVAVLALLYHLPFGILWRRRQGKGKKE